MHNHCSEKRDKDLWLKLPQVLFEPPHDKTNKMTAPSEDSDQPGHQPFCWFCHVCSSYIVCKQWSLWWDCTDGHACLSLHLSHKWFAPLSPGSAQYLTMKTVNRLGLESVMWAPSSEFVSSSIPSWQISTAHAQPFRGARDLAFCLKVPLDSLLVWASSGGSDETVWMHRLAWTFAARIGDKYQIRSTRSMWLLAI